jgi:E3 ubiquitin-protein ligase HECTD2
MSSWSGRNPPIPSTTSPGFTALPLHPPSVPASDHSRRRPSQTHDAPTMAPLNVGIPTGPQRRGHHRSISHPFTSPFTGIGKKRDKAAPKYNTYDSDSDSDDVTFSAQPTSSPRKEVKGGHGNEMTEGKCQTCNSTVRWPRNSKVFRCSSCLMVTDLEVELPKDAKSPGDPEHEDRARGGRSRDPAEQDSSLLSPHEPKPGI